MRISTQQVFQQNLTGMLDMQARAAELQLQVTTGKRILSPSDDPSGASRALRLDERISAVDQYQRNGGLATMRLGQQEDAITSVGDGLQRIRELILAGKNTALTLADRRFIAAEIEQRRDELVALANTQNDVGEYVFAGMAVETRPFQQAPDGSVSYAGDQSVRELQVGESRRIGDGFSGHEVFMAARNGNGTFVTDIGATNGGSGRIVAPTVVDPAAFQTHDFRIVFTGPAVYDIVDDTAGSTVVAGQAWVADAAIAFNGISVAITGAPAAGDEFLIGPSLNQSVFATIDETIAALNISFNGADDEARFHQGMDRALGDIDQSREKMLEIRASIGARMNTLESQQGINEDLSVRLKATRSDLEDADLVEVISQLAQQTNALQAAQAAFVRVQGLSLFNFL